MKAAEAVAHATIAAIKKHTNYPTVVGIGGPHGKGLWIIVEAPPTVKIS